jgi:quinol monooxygenase YgiN
LSLLDERFERVVAQFTESSDLLVGEWVCRRVPHFVLRRPIARDSPVLQRGADLLMSKHEAHRYPLPSDARRVGRAPRWLGPRFVERNTGAAERRMRSLLKKRTNMAEHAQVSVVARFLARPGKEEQVKRTLLDMIAPTRQEEANVSYDLYQAKDRPALFIMEENWRSQEGLARHWQTRHFQAMDATLADLLVEHHADVMEMISPEAT